MTDRLAQTSARADANIERHKAARIAPKIFDMIHDNVATKQDPQHAEGTLLPSGPRSRHWSNECRCALPRLSIA
jgi:hypothetical protein